MMQLGFRIIICHHYIEFVEKSKTYFGGFLVAVFLFLLFLFLYCQYIVVLYLSCEKNEKCIVSTWDVVDALPEKAMAPHSSTLAWKIPWTEEPGRLQSMGSLGVGHYWATYLSFFTFMLWRRKWQPTPVFLPGESQGRGSLGGCRLWGRTESDTTEVT